jgi:hypothetical protein
MFFAGGSGSPSIPDLLAFTTLCRNAWVTNMLGTHTPGVSLRAVTGTYLGDVGVQKQIVNGSNNGTRGGGNLYASTALIVNLSVPRRYRGGHPRLYLPLGSQTDMLDPQHWTPSFLTTVSTSWNAWLAAVVGFTGVTFQPVVFSNVSYFHNNALRPVPVVDPVTASSMNPIPGTQRRRLRP